MSIDILDLTILICTHNSAKRISPTLEHLKNQKNTEQIKWEVIIVDYISSDGTADIAQELWADYCVPLFVIHETRAGKTPALETGLRSARGSSVCIVDDDNWVFENYVVVAHNIMKDNPAVGVIGAFGEAYCETAPPAWFKAYEGIYAVGNQGTKRGYVDNPKRLWFWGAGSVIRKEAWLKAKEKGFKPIFNSTRGAGSTYITKGFTSGEDPELCYAIQLVGYRLWYEPDLKYQHFIAQSRLTPSFINDAVSGSAAAAPLIRVYLAEVTPHSILGVIRKTLYKNWLLHMLYLLLKYPYSVIKTYFINPPDKAIEVDKIHKGYMSEIRTLYQLRVSFDEIVSSISKLSI